MKIGVNIECGKSQNQCYSFPVAKKKKKKREKNEQTNKQIKKAKGFRAPVQCSGLKDAGLQGFITFHLGLQASL